MLSRRANGGVSCISSYSGAGVDDNEIARRVLSWIPDDFKGKMLDVPVGTAVFTTEKYKRMKQTDITCLDRDDSHGLVYASIRHGQRRAQASGTLLRNPRLPRRGSYALFQGQKEIIISFRYYNSLFYCTSGFAEGTLARKYSNKFGISLAYSYLCTRWIYRVSSYHF